MPETMRPAGPDDANRVRVGRNVGITLFGKDRLDVLMRMPLPGVVIFVHGVNSDGEWYEAAEAGLCRGLNERLRRCDEHLVRTGTDAGQLRPARYLKELTPEGFINPKLLAGTFIESDDAFSPVIRFRWGYKASGEELRRFGAGLLLNERNQWGGGPFANGCSSLPDLWGAGIEDELFAFLHVQHLNPTADRQVYACPPRAYFVLAAWRLAKLIESIRLKQADVPVTIVCHSQGNMVGMAAAFLGDRMDAKAGRSSRGLCVADTYVLCNPPYSLVADDMAADNWAQRHMQDRQGRRGRQTFRARAGTLAAFFDIVGKRKSLHQACARIDQRMANARHGFTAAADRERHGLGGSTCGRATLYFNPHDQVISASTVQGIGWRGMSDAEIAATHGRDVYTQRIYAEGFAVGDKLARRYDYWRDHRRQPLAPGSLAFWHPESPRVRYSIRKGMEADRGLQARMQTLEYAPLLIVAMHFADMRVNALPPKVWAVPLDAPPLPQPFLPQALRFGTPCPRFDQDHEPPGAQRDRTRARPAGDPYAGTHRVHDREGEHDDAAQGDVDTEASLRYEHHATLRMRAKRAGLYRNDQDVIEEDRPEEASTAYTVWRTRNIQSLLAETVDTHATDHSTILTNPMHAQRAIAYDVAIGNCDIEESDLRQFRMMADWRHTGFADIKFAGKTELRRYMRSGQFGGVSLARWADGGGTEGAMPETIADERTGSTYLLGGVLF